MWWRRLCRNDKKFFSIIGWDENKIYNVGGYWYYKGKHSINVKKEIDGKVTYDFDSVPYHKIEFNKLTKSSNYRAPIIKVTELKINTSKIELEEGTSFKLNVIVLPNEATNKEVKWLSNNEMVATVTNDGLVEAVGAGYTTINVQSIDGNKIVSCEVTVNKKVISTRIKLDDVSKEAEEFAAYDFEKIYQEFSYIDEEVRNQNENPKYHTRTESGGYRINELGIAEYKKKQDKEEAGKKRLEIFNKLIDNKKFFVLLIRTKNCEGSPYPVYQRSGKNITARKYSIFRSRFSSNRWRSNT